MNPTLSGTNPQFQQTINRQVQSTATENSSGWSILPSEILCNILGMLPFHDLVPCQRLNRRTTEVIQDNLLLPKAYYKQLQTAYVETCYTAEMYDSEIRSWLMEAGKSSEVLWLDSLKSHSVFPKVLFYTISKTKIKADYWGLVKKWQFKMVKDDHIDYLLSWNHLKFTPDGRAIAFIRHTDRKLNIMTIGRGTFPDRNDQFPLDRGPLHSIDVSPNSETLAVIYHCGNVVMVEKERSGWTTKYRSDYPLPQNGSISKRYFSSDSQYFLTILSSGALRVLGKQGGAWVPKMELDAQRQHFYAQFVPGLSCIAFASPQSGLVIMDVESNKVVAQGRKWDLIHHISQCGCRLAVGSSKTLSAIVSFCRGAWRASPIPSKHVRVSQVRFSPDGQHLASVSRQAYCYEDKQKSVRVISFDGASWQESGYYIEINEQKLYIFFSPNSRLFFVYTPGSALEFPPTHAVLSNGLWEFCDTRANCAPVRPIRFSPDGRSAIYTDSHSHDRDSRLLRYRAGKWSVAHKIEGPTSSQVRYSSDNRTVFLFFGNEIHMLEIQPKNDVMCDPWLMRVTQVP